MAPPTGMKQYDSFFKGPDSFFIKAMFRATKKTEVSIRKTRHKNLMQYRRRDACRYNMAPSTQLSNIRNLAHGRVRQHEGAFRGYKRR
jgi:hypothetical protein